MVMEMKGRMFDIGGVFCVTDLEQEKKRSSNNSDINKNNCNNKW